MKVRERKLLGNSQRWKELVFNEYFVHLVFESCSSARVKGKIPALCWRCRTLDSGVLGWERHSDGIIYEWTSYSVISQAFHPWLTRGKAGKKYPVVTRTLTGQAERASAQGRLQLRGPGRLSAGHWWGAAIFLRVASYYKPNFHGHTLEAWYLFSNISLPFALFFFFKLNYDLK